MDAAIRTVRATCPECGKQHMKRWNMLDSTCLPCSEEMFPEPEELVGMRFNELRIDDHGRLVR